MSEMTLLEILENHKLPVGVSPTDSDDPGFVVIEELEEGMLLISYAPDMKDYRYGGEFVRFQVHVDQARRDYEVVE